MLKSGITKDLENKRTKFKRENKSNKFILKDFLKNIIFSVLQESIGSSFSNFIEKLEKQDIKFITHSKKGKKLKHIKIFYKDYKNPIYLNSLGNEYTEENIKNILKTGNVDILNNKYNKTNIIDVFLSEQEKKEKLEKEFNDYNRYGFTFSKFKNKSFIQLLDNKLYVVLKDKKTHNNKEFSNLYINFSNPKNASHKANIKFNNDIIAGLGAANLLSNIGAEYEVAYVDSNNVSFVSKQTKNHKNILNKIDEHLHRELENYFKLKEKYLNSNAPKKLLLKKKLNKKINKIQEIKYKKNDVIKAIKLTKDYAKYKAREEELYK